MFDLSYPDQPIIPTKSLLRVLRNTPLTLPEADHDKLQAHLEDCECATRPGYRLLAYVLANKLMNTRPVSGVCRTDQAVGGSHVTYVIDADAPRTGVLSHRAATDSDTDTILVASLLGATLIGMVVGQRAPLLCKDGKVRRLSVIDVQGSV